MELSDDTCYRALTARDRRFDGVFFVGVTTTGVYCRPICPARTPGAARCRYFANAASAERAGFRPCLRCRPELAPGNAPVDAAGRIAQAVVRRIEAGALTDGAGLPSLARELRLSDRQIRRILRQTLGVSPIALAQTHRLLTAKRLLTDSRLPLTQVAFASGFASVRRFNSLFRARYLMPPGRLRRRGAAADDGVLRLSLDYRPPLAWERLLDFLAARAAAGVEHVEAGSYSRTVRLGKHSGWVRVSQAPDRAALIVELPESLTPSLSELLVRLRDTFDLDAHPAAIGTHLERDPRLRPLVRRDPGLRAPGAFDGFETAVRAILGQQVSVRAASTLAARLANAFGEPATTPFAQLQRFAPSATALAAARPGALVALGITAARAESIRVLARSVADGQLHLRPGVAIEEATAALRALPGVGEWTAQYVALRVFRWPDAFPTGDAALARAWRSLGAKDLAGAAEAWRPWRGYAAVYLWQSLSNPKKE